MSNSQYFDATFVESDIKKLKVIIYNSAWLSDTPNVRLYHMLLILISLWSCKAQTVVSYDSDEDVFIKNSGDYYKDTSNEFNKYEGEYIITKQ